MLFFLEALTLTNAARLPPATMEKDQPSLATNTISRDEFPDLNSIEIHVNSLKEVNIENCLGSHVKGFIWIQQKTQASYQLLKACIQG